MIDFSIVDFREAQLGGLPEVAAALKKDGVYNITGEMYGRYEGKKFKTRSRKIELFNIRYDERGIDPMPTYRPPEKIPANRFRLVVGRNALISQSSSTNNKLLCELQQENTLWFHPQAAQLTVRAGNREVRNNIDLPVLFYHLNCSDKRLSPATA